MVAGRRRVDELELEVDPVEVEEPLDGGLAADYDEPAAQPSRAPRGAEDETQCAAGEVLDGAEVDYDERCIGGAAIEQRGESWLGGEVEVALEGESRGACLECELVCEGRGAREGRRPAG